MPADPNQKELDLISYMRWMRCAKSHTVILGTGEERYENMFRPLPHGNTTREGFGKHLLF